MNSYLKGAVNIIGEAATVVSERKTAKKLAALLKLSPVDVEFELWFPYGWPLVIRILWPLKDDEAKLLEV
jgi:hypothetical protein